MLHTESCTLNPLLLAALPPHSLPTAPFLVQLKSLLDDFAGHNIDAACALVEAAGRFFYRWAGEQLRCMQAVAMLCHLAAYAC